MMNRRCVYEGSGRGNDHDGLIENACLFCQIYPCDLCGCGCGGGDRGGHGLDSCCGDDAMSCGVHEKTSGDGFDESHVSDCYVRKTVVNLCLCFDHDGEYDCYDHVKMTGDEVCVSHAVSSPCHQYDYASDQTSNKCTLKTSNESVKKEEA